MNDAAMAGWRVPALSPVYTVRKALRQNLSLAYHFHRCYASGVPGVLAPPPMQLYEKLSPRKLKESSQWRYQGNVL